MGCLRVRILSALDVKDETPLSPTAAWDALSVCRCVGLLSASWGVYMHANLATHYLDITCCFYICPIAHLCAELQGVSRLGSLVFTVWGVGRDVASRRHLPWTRSAAERVSDQSRRRSVWLERTDSPAIQRLDLYNTVKHIFVHLDVSWTLDTATLDNIAVKKKRPKKNRQKKSLAEGKNIALWWPHWQLHCEAVIFF